MKRRTLLIVALVALSAAALSATVKPAQESKQPAAAAAVQHPVTPQSTEAPGHEPATVHKAEAVEHEAGEAEAAESPWATVARLFNFALVAGALIYFLRSPFAAFLDNRKVQIRKSLADAAATREDATRQLAVIDQKLHALPGELEAVKRRGAAEIAAEEERIRQAAEVERQRMLENAKRDIERHAHLAERRLTQRAGELAVSLATERVTRTINDDDQARLVDRYLEQVRPETMGS